MRRLGGEAEINELAKNLGLPSIYDFLSKEDISATNTEIAGAMVRIRNEVRKLRSAGDETISNLILNYMLLRASGDTIPDTLTSSLARYVPGIYIYSGERVLVEPGETPPTGLQIDTDYMDRVVDAVTEVDGKWLKIAGVSYGIIDYDYVYRKFFDYKLAEESVKKSLLDTLQDLGVSPVKERVYRKSQDEIVAEAELSATMFNKSTGSLTVSITAKRNKRAVTLEALYEDDVVRIRKNTETEYLGSLKDVLERLREALDKYELIKESKALALKRGYKWVIDENQSSATKTVQVAGQEVNVSITYVPGTYGNVTLSLEAPKTEKTVEAFEKLASYFNGEIEEKDGTVQLSFYHSLTKSSAESVIKDADAVVSKLDELLMEKPIQAELTEADKRVAIGLILLKAVGFDIAIDSTKLSFMEALKHVFKDVPEITSRVYSKPQEALQLLSKMMDVRDDGEILVSGELVDDCLAPYKLDRKTIQEIKRNLVSSSGTSLSATLLARGVEITPAVLRKLIDYGDLVPPAVLEHQYNGRPLWSYLSRDEKLEVVSRLLKHPEHAEALSKADFMELEDSSILVIAKCMNGSPDCTKQAYFELRDELQIPRHAVLKQVSNDTYIDTGAYLVKITGYDTATGFFKFNVYSKSTGKTVEIKTRTFREAVSQASEEEDKELELA